MTRRRRASARLALFGPAVPLAAAGWQRAGEPLHFAGMLAACALALAVVPLVLLAAWTAWTAFPSCLVTQRARARHRKRHGRQHCRSARIPARLRRAVKAADQYRCVARRLGGCAGSIEVDHGCPWSDGGVTWLANMFALCRWHNRVKSNYWRFRSGRVTYRPFPGADDEALAASVLAAERRARLNPVRWLRAAWAL